MEHINLSLLITLAVDVKIIMDYISSRTSMVQTNKMAEAQGKIPLDKVTFTEQKISYLMEVITNTIVMYWLNVLLFMITTNLGLNAWSLYIIFVLSIFVECLISNLIYSFVSMLVISLASKHHNKRIMRDKVDAPDSPEAPSDLKDYLMKERERRNG